MTAVTIRRRMSPLQAARYPLAARSVLVLVTYG